MDYSFDNIPADIAREIISKLDMKELVQVSQVSKRYHIFASEQILKLIKKGYFREQGWGPEREFDFAEWRDNNIKTAVIEDFLYRLHDNSVINNLKSKGFLPSSYIGHFDPYKDRTVEYIIKDQGGSNLVGNYLSDNDNTSLPDVLENPNVNWDYYSLHRNRNFTWNDLQSLKGLFPSIEFSFREYSANQNIRFVDLQSISVNTLDWCSLSSNPNMTMKIITKSKEEGKSKKKNRKKLWSTLCATQNPNISPEEVMADRSRFPNLYSILDNPNITDKFMENHQEEFRMRDISGNRFNRDPAYRYLLYSYIYQLLPEIVTINIDNNEITEKKEFLYGMLAAIKALNLSYNITYHDTKLHLEDYRMFTIGNANQPYLIRIRGFPFHVTSPLDFLQGVKTIYDNNEIPFDITHFYDKKQEYAKVAIQ